VREGGESRHATVCGMGRELAHKAKAANSSMSPSGLPTPLGFISVYIQDGFTFKIGLLSSPKQRPWIDFSKKV